MTTFLIIIGIIVYAVGIFTYIDLETSMNFKWHDGGFLGLGYTTNDYRETTTKDARLSLLWPVLLVFWFIKTLLWVFNDCLGFVFLLFRLDYRNTKIYNYIDKKLS